MSLAEASLCLERNEPPITQVYIYFYEWETKLYLILHRLQTDPEFTFERDEYSNVADWRRLCRDIGNNSTIRRLYLSIPNEPNQAQAIQPAHIRGFLDELKDNNSIEELQVDPVIVILTQFDLGYFLRNSTNIKDLTLGSLLNGEELVTPEQARIIATALDGVQLRKLNIEDMEFENNESMEQIISHCLGVETLELVCYTSSHYTALATLLRNPRSIMQTLLIEPIRDEESDEEDFDQRLAVSEIAASLVHKLLIYLFV
jgi:hypothetical protein